MNATFTPFPARCWDPIVEESAPAPSLFACPQWVSQCHCDRNLPIGYASSVEVKTPLPQVPPARYRLRHVHFHFVRTLIPRWWAIPVRVNPPPAKIGEPFHSTCATLETGFPKRRADRAIVRTLAGFLYSGVRNNHLLLRHAIFRAQAVAAVCALSN